MLLSGIKDEDTVVFVGDLVDRGPDSIGVIRLAYNLPNRILVQGNHEKKHIRFWNALHDDRRGPEIRAKMLGHTPELLKLENGLTADEKQWLRDSPFFMRLPGNNIVVHAGFPESIQELPETHAGIVELPNKQRRRMEQLLHVRKLSADGRFVPLKEQEDRGEDFWAEHYDGRFGFAWFGHQPHFRGWKKEYSNAIALDTGCVYGESLTAAILDPDGKFIGYRRVPAQRPYAPCGAYP